MLQARGSGSSSVFWDRGQHSTCKEQGGPRRPCPGFWALAWGCRHALCMMARIGFSLENESTNGSIGAWIGG